MNKKIGIIYSMLLLVLCSCHNELTPLSGRDIREGVPVQFTVECPQYDMQTTRSITDKREFKTGDVIHVSAVFKLDKEGESEKQYATLTLTEEGWVNETDFPMNWPCRKCDIYCLLSGKMEWTYYRQHPLETGSIRSLRIPDNRREQS